MTSQKIHPPRILLLRACLWGVFFSLFNSAYRSISSNRNWEEEKPALSSGTGKGMVTHVAPVWFSLYWNLQPALLSFYQENDIT